MNINKFKISDKYGREDIVIDKKTTIEPTQAPFEYRSQEDDLSISSLAHIAPEQLIAIKGYLAHLTGIKRVIIQGSEVPKQEGYITDPSGHIKIILWGRHALQEGYTYFFNKVRIKVNQGQKYLNTPTKKMSVPLILLLHLSSLPALWMKWQLLKTSSLPSLE